MSDANRKSKLSVLLMASLITTNLVFASDYKNNVVDVKVNKESNNAVKVTIYTDKPYTEPVVVNKKANNKYVILMPETKSSLKSTPSVSNVSGTVNNVSVNTQAVSGGKGYTKIIITSEKAITVVPRTQTVSSTTASKPNTAVKTVPQKTTVDKNAEALKAQQEQAKKAAAQKAQQEAKAKQLAAQKAQQEKAKKLAAQQKAQKEAEARRLAEQKAQQERARKLAEEKAAAERAAQAVKPVSPKTQEKKPIEILEQEVKTDKNANFSQNNNDPVLNQEIQENIEKNKKEKAKKKKTSVQYANTGNQSVIENIKAVIRDYQNVSLWKLLLLASAITFPLVVIMIILGMDKKINKRIDKSFKRDEHTRYEEQAPVVPDTVPPVLTEGQQTQSFNSFEDMLNQVEEPVPSFHEEQLYKAQYEQFQQSVVQPDEEVVSEEIVQEDVPVVEEAEPEIITEEFENDFVNDDFEHDFVQETEPDAIQNTQVPQTVEPAQPYVPDGYLSDFSGVNDKEFFDELVLQSMAENNINGLPEESPADEIFDFMSDDTEKFEKPQEPVVYNDISEPVVVENNGITQEESIQQLAGSTVDSVEQNIITHNEPEITPVEKSVTEQPQPQPEDDLTMLTEVKLSDNTGLYLVNYENFSSLVGHINDDYFVIKKFDDVVNANIILKQAEKLKNATRYLVRVGKNKMVVEVTEKSMSRLLDL